MYSGDKPLCEALQLMHHEGISSVAVIDSHFNVVGNISTVDVKVRSEPPKLVGPMTHEWSPTAPYTDVGIATSA